MLMKCLILFLITRDLVTSKLSVGRVWNGRPMDVNEIPFIASVMKFDKTKDEAVPVCTGSLIHPKWIITAAHCFTDKETRPNYAAIGATDMYNRNSLSTIYEVYLHPNYIPSLYSQGELVDSDLALIHLKEPVGLLTNAQVLKIDRNHWEMGEDFSRNCTIIGFGINKYNDIALRASTFILRNDPKRCGCYFVTMNQFLCVGFEQHHDGTCPGDSGGPVICDQRLVAVVTGAGLCREYPSHIEKKLKDACNDILYGYFKLLNPHMAWIKRVIPT